MTHRAAVNFSDLIDALDHYRRCKALANELCSEPGVYRHRGEATNEARQKLNAAAQALGQVDVLTKPLT